MNITFDRVQVSLTESECRDLRYCLYVSLEKTIKEHWVNFPSEWKKHEAQKLQMLETLCRFTNYRYEDELSGLEKTLKDCLAKRAV